MRTRYLLAAVAATLMGFAAAAWAQTISVPQVSIINPNDLVQVVPNGSPGAQNFYAIPAQLTSQMGYVKASPITGFTYTFGNSQSMLVLTNSTTLALGTVTFAAAPSDGAQECVYAQNTVTGFALAKGATSQTINNAVTTIAAAAQVCYLYSLSNQTWDRSK